MAGMASGDRGARWASPGKLVVALMVLVGLALGGIAWWHRLESGKQVLQSWGAAAIAVRHAPQVELLVPAADVTVAESGGAPLLLLSLGTQELTRRRDLSRTPGVVHARHALIEDFNYDWTPREPGALRHWDFALRFVETDGTAHTLAFDLAARIVLLVETGRELSLKPELSNAFRKKLAEWQRL